MCWGTRCTTVSGDGDATGSLVAGSAPSPRDRREASLLYPCRPAGDGDGRRARGELGAAHHLLGHLHRVDLHVPLARGDQEHDLRPTGEGPARAPRPSAAVSARSREGSERSSKPDPTAPQLRLLEGKSSSGISAAPVARVPGTKEPSHTRHARRRRCVVRDSCALPCRSWRRTRRR